MIFHYHIKREFGLVKVERMTIIKERYLITTNYEK